MPKPIIKEIKDEFYNKVHPITELKAVFDENGTSLEEILNTTVVTDVDDELSNISVNPVQNRVITEALNNKANSSDLEELSDEVDTKADISTVNALSDKVDTKANTTDVDEAITRTYNSLYNSFSEALTALKNTAIAMAVGATGDTFTAVIAKLATIINRGKVTQTLNTSTTSYTIPAGYHNGQGSVSISTQTKSATPTTSTQTINPDSGKVLSSVSVGAIQTQTKSVTPTTSNQIIYPDSGKYLSSVSIGTQSHSGIYAATSRSSALDLGTTHNIRYINTNNVPSTTVNGGATILFSCDENKDLYGQIIPLGGFTNKSFEYRKLNLSGGGVRSTTYTISTTDNIQIHYEWDGYSGNVVGFVENVRLINNTGQRIYYEYNYICNKSPDGTNLVSVVSSGNPYVDNNSYASLLTGRAYHNSNNTNAIFGAFTVRIWKV